MTIWSRLDAPRQICTRLMIQRPLFGNWVMIVPEFGSRNIIIQYLNMMEIPPLPTLLIIEPHNLSTDRSDEELQFEEIQLTWSTNHLTINPLISHTNIQQNTNPKKMSHHHSYTSPSMRERNILDDIGSYVRESGM